MTRLPFPHIDRNQALRQLELLGYLAGDQVFLRCIKPGGGLAEKIPAVFPYLPWEQLEQYQRNGLGVYFVVHGQGQSDKDVHFGRAIFCEWDDLPKPEQHQKVKALGLPAPTFWVETRKSVHFYWVLEQPIPVDQWRSLQLDLLKFTQSDQSLKNSSRVLRLAGAWHVKPNHDPIQCTLGGLQ